MHVALLRGINVGKAKPVAMADLAAMMGELGFSGVRTLLRSGNVVFDGGSSPSAELEALLERELASRLELKSQVFVRTTEQWLQAIAHNPFPAEAEHDPARLHLVALRETAKPGAAAGLQEANPGREQIRTWDRYAYVFYPDGAADTKLTPSFWGRWLPPGTARNWNTTLKLQVMLQA